MSEDERNMWFGGLYILSAVVVILFLYLSFSFPVYAAYAFFLWVGLCFLSVVLYRWRVLILLLTGAPFFAWYFLTAYCEPCL